jgi:Ca-activated chloride channel family protein
MTIAAKTDRALIRARASSSRYVLLRVTAPVAEGTTARPAVNVAFVVDRSGSMDGDRKFPLAVEATERALKPLDAADRFSVIVFDNSIDVVHASSPASPEAKREALRRLQRVDPRGSTNLGAGWLAGCWPGWLWRPSRPRSRP